MWTVTARRFRDHSGVEVWLRLFAQERNWQAVRGVEDVPTSYRDGTLFVTRKPAMPRGQ